MYFQNELELALAKNKLPVASLITVLAEIFRLANDEEDDTVHLVKRNYSHYEIGITKIPDMYQLGTDYGYQTVQSVLQNLKGFIETYNYDMPWKEPIVKVLTTHDLNCASINVEAYWLSNILNHMIDVY